jgi:hypothetical protein
MIENSIEERILLMLHYKHNATVAKGVLRTETSESLTRDELRFIFGFQPTLTGYDLEAETASTTATTTTTANGDDTMAVADDTTPTATTTTA